MKKALVYICFLIVLLSCKNFKEGVDMIIYNAKIYSVDSSFSVKEAMAIKDGKIVKTGTDEMILKEFNAKEIQNIQGKYIFPGFIDAHCHFLSYGLGLKQLDLVGTKSFNEVIERIKEFTKTNKTEWIIGRGWDQNDWAAKEYPNKKILDSLFPETPIILKRIDGHAALVNTEVLKRTGINLNTKIDGGELITDTKGNLTGILIDNAVDIVTNKMPPPSKEQLKQALLAAQKNCFAFGLTTIDDAGLKKSEIDMIDELQKKNELKMRIYAMLSPNAENLTHYLKHGIYKTNKLTVRSFKFYADGALGSRGACLLNDYSDKPKWKGFLLNKKEYFEKYAELMAEKGFQLNTHCIGDSAVRLILSIYSKYFNNHCMASKNFPKESADKTLRWRIEHFQISTYSDLDYLQCLNSPSSSPNAPQIIPSVQSTHATSDMYWAEKKLGKERLNLAYAYKNLLKATGMLALGTDFPVEDISPFKTFYASVYRKDSKGFPAGGFQIENALSREETIKGMTIWAAYANFEEKEKGSLEKNKYADFIILDTDLLNCKEDKILQTKVLSTFIAGKEVYKK